MTIAERRIGKTSVPMMGQGTWQMEFDPRESTIAAIRRGLDLGMTHIDTAEMYGGGRVEEIVGEAIDGRRDEVYLVSKVLPSNASRRGTIKACEQSLRYLRTDALDLYLLHWSGSHPLEDTFAAFEELLQAGKIKQYGVSNFDVDELEEAWKISGDQLACNQVLYNLDHRGIEHRVLPWCKERGVAVVAYSPLGQGDFPRRGKSATAVKEIGDARDSTPEQIALAFLLRDESVLTIPKASRVDHVEQNAAAAQLRLSPEEIDRIDAMFPLGRSKRLPML